jgi:hypothetical protein
MFQALDSLLSGRLKATKKYLSHNYDFPAQLDHVMCAFRAYEIATANTMTRASWEKTGFEYVKRERTYSLFVW